MSHNSVNKNQEMKIEQRDVDALTPYAFNAKKHDAKQVANIANSLKKFGFVQPVVVDAEGVIVIGHGRVLAAKKLGMKTVPTVVVDDLTPEQVRELRIADNKLNESEWDFDLLAQDIDGLAFEGFDFDLGVLPAEPEVVEDDFPIDEVLEELEMPTTQFGDIWILGRHRLMCGDSTDRKMVQTLCGGQAMDMLLTDPPYNVNYEGTAGKIENDNMEDKQFRAFLTDAFQNASAVMKPGAAFHIWHADSEGYNFRGACNDAGLKIRQCLIWVKNSLVLGRQDFQWKHEPCLYGEKPYDGLEEFEDPEDHQPCLYGWKDGKHYWFKNRKQTTILEFDKPKKSKEHPTMKPIRLFDYEMQCNSRPGDCVLDLFAGSGTTIMACEQNGRTAYCMEFDPKYADVIVKRWEEFTGKQAERITSIGAAGNNRGGGD